MAALATDTASAPPAPAVPPMPRGARGLQLRLIVSIPAILILVALIYGLVSYLSFSMFWDDLDKTGAGDIARELLRIHMNALIMLAFASACAGVVLSTTILRPIRALLEATRQVADGRLDRHTPHVSGARELDDLSSSFNQMIDTINHSISERSRRIMEGIPIGVISTDLDGRIGAVSPLACQILGLPAEAVSGRLIADLAAAPPLVERLLALVGRRAPQTTGEVALDDRTLTLNSTLLRDGDGRPFGFMFSLREAAHMRDLTTQLSRSDQLAALGTFTLGLAHELRNPLAAIKGFSQLLLLERDLPPRVADYLDRMVFEVDRVESLVRQLFDLSEQPLACRIPTNLNKTLEKATEAAQQAVDPARLREVKIKLDLRPHPPLLLEHDRLVQAFAKIIQNAYEFAAEGAVITLITRQEKRAVPPAWRVEVRNTGSAIAPENLRRVFEPFFTTRDKATGLGLTIARQIAAQNGARLEAEMEDGEVVFRAVFENPRLAEAAAVAQASSPHVASGGSDLLTGGQAGAQSQGPHVASGGSDLLTGGQAA